MNQIESEIVHHALLLVDRVNAVRVGFETDRCFCDEIGVLVGLARELRMMRARFMSQNDLQRLLHRFGGVMEFQPAPSSVGHILIRWCNVHVGDERFTWDVTVDTQIQNSLASVVVAFRNKLLEAGVERSLV